LFLTDDEPGGLRVDDHGNDSAHSGRMPDGLPENGDRLPDEAKSLAYTAVARLELDDLLTQLVERAQDVLATQGRLRGLLRANRMITTDLRLPVLLRLIVEAACELTDVRYGALGVIAPDRTLEEFIHVGLDADAEARIGHLPTGRGLLGALIDDPRPRRVDDIATDPAAAGFPPGHPAMRTFLGVPITVRGEVFGNLYLTDRRDGRPFTAEDEELVLALAANAGIAIENARLFEDSQRRHQWMSASAEVTRLLMTDARDPLAVIASRVRPAASADYVAVATPTGDAKARVAVAPADSPDSAGPSGDVGDVGDLIELDGTLIGQALAEGHPILVANPRLDAVPPERGPDTASLLVLPLPAQRAEQGAVILIGRDRRAPAFTESELEMAANFAGHAALAWELSRTRADRERLLVAADRGRIARDLHDHVIQRIFAVALGLQDLAQYESPANADRLAGYVEDIDATIKDIRRTIFELRTSSSPAPSRVRGAVDKIVADARPGLGFAPTVRFGGPLEAVVDDALADHLCAVVRESLSNAARHARATAVDVAVRVVGDQLLVEVDDDGVGLGSSTRRSGLGNLRTRAESLGGTFTLDSAPGEGTHLRWSVPL
jgi:signal transduction histidine kinase